MIWLAFLHYLLRLDSLANAQGLSSHASGCSDGCYSAIATYDNDYDPYGGNGICYSWLSHYPPAHTTETITQTPPLAYVFTTTYTTRTETVWSLDATTANAAPKTFFVTASPSPTVQPRFQPEQQQISLSKSLEAKPKIQRDATNTSTVAGLPLPNSGIAMSCSNDPASFYSACSCIGDTSQTYYEYATSTVSTTITEPTYTRECTTTMTSGACAATAAFGLRAQPIRFGDTGIPTSSLPIFASNSSTAAECCRLCYASTKNCRYFSYTALSNTTDAFADGGTCQLDLEGDICPYNTLPTFYYGPQYNYITEGMYSGALGGGSLYGFGPCSEEVPYFYGYQAGRAGIGDCPAVNPSVSTSIVN
ncbi:hypothetical protein MMC10_008786 [Thelotrema lepadinum]|nr:hypothetical protein [Thelotrema lepadinum]